MKTNDETREVAKFKSRVNNADNFWQVDFHRMTEKWLFNAS